jgi:CRP/FNR family cyclic AMP-dependent transcriptional regulator
MDLARFLQTVPTFSGLTQPELEVLERALRVDDFPTGHTFLEEGQKSRNLYIVMDGVVERFRRRKVGQGLDDLGVLKNGELFGLHSLVCDQRQFSTCRAITPVTVASLPKTAFYLLYNAHVSISEHFQYIAARQLSHDLRRLNVGVMTSICSGEVAPLYKAARETGTSS